MNARNPQPLLSSRNVTLPNGRTYNVEPNGSSGVLEVWWLHCVDSGVEISVVSALPDEALIPWPCPHGSPAAPEEEVRAALDSAYPRPERLALVRDFNAANLSWLTVAAERLVRRYADGRWPIPGVDEDPVELKLMLDRALLHAALAHLPEPEERRRKMGLPRLCWCDQPVPTGVSRLDAATERSIEVMCSGLVEEIRGDAAAFLCEIFAADADTEAALWGLIDTLQGANRSR